MGIAHCVGFDKKKNYYAWRAVALSQVADHV
jgi:hypothetical protein